MSIIRIVGVVGYDGDYELDLSYFTNRELHTLKRLTGVRPGELEEAMGAGDTDLVVALAVIALQRSGKSVDEDAIWDAPVGKITFTDEGNDASPPELAQPSSLESDGEPDAGGPTSRSAGVDQPASAPSSTGPPG